MKKYAYWLSNIKGLGTAKKNALYKMGFTAEEIYTMSENRLYSISLLKKEEADAILSSKTSWNMEKAWFALMEKGIGFVSVEDEAFPSRLKGIPMAPHSLYYIGNLPEEDNKAIAIVGARGRSAYGSEVTGALAQSLSRHGVQIISGLAKGIDTDAHSGALEGGTPTFAVLGCGVDVCYPTSNRYLYHKILEEGGGIISEHPPGTQPLACYFPTRNRIIAGLSDVVAVMEARIKSGSLITAEFAMDQGKDVYVLPGRITDPLSMGCNRLISQGAGIIESVDDFLLQMRIVPGEKTQQLDFYQNLLEKDESMVYSQIDFRPMGFGILMDITGLSFDRLLEIIRNLTAMGMIKESFPNHYIRTYKE